MAIWSLAILFATLITISCCFCRLCQLKMGVLHMCQFLFVHVSSCCRHPKTSYRPMNVQHCFIGFAAHVALLLQCVRCSGVRDGTSGHRCYCRKKCRPAIPDARLLLQSDPPVAFDGQATTSSTAVAHGDV